MASLEHLWGGFLWSSCSRGSPVQCTIRVKIGKTETSLSRGGRWLHIFGSFCIWMGDMLPALKPISENSREKVVCLFSFPRTFSFIVAHPIPIPEIKKKEKTQNNPFLCFEEMVLRGCLVRQWIKDSGLPGWAFGKGSVCSCEAWGSPASEHLKSYSLHPESRIILRCTKPPEIMYIYLSIYLNFVKYI